MPDQTLAKQGHPMEALPYNLPGIASLSKPVLFSNVSCSQPHCFEKCTTSVQRASRTLHTEQRSGPAILGWNVFVSTLHSKMGFVKEKGESLLAVLTEHNVLD